MLRIMIIGILISSMWNPTCADPPNIVIFLVDDMGWQDTSVPFGPEETVFNRRYRTPNMERLAGLGWAGALDNILDIPVSAKKTLFGIINDI